MEVLEVFGNPPQACFGHTICYLPSGTSILFGGATGDTGRYSITNEVFCFQVEQRVWKKVETNGKIPSARAAHSSTTVENNQIVVYGGATGGGSLASDDLYLLDFKESDSSGVWTIVQTSGPTPGRRYGQTMAYCKPYIIIFGGNTGQEPVNDCWILNVEKSPFLWVRLDFSSALPEARVYHTMSLCQYGTANNMIVMYGGRGKDGTALNDTWGIRKHRNGTWDWIKAPYKSGSDQPMPRYQHSSLFIGSCLFLIGGRTNQFGETAGIEIYDTETSVWFRVAQIQRFRHACFHQDQFLYVFAGFEHDSPNIPNDKLIRISLAKVLKGNEAMLNKLKSIVNMSPQVSNKRVEIGITTPKLYQSPQSQNKEITDRQRIEIEIPKQNEPKIQISKQKIQTKNFKICGEAIVVEENKLKNDIQFKKVNVGSDIIKKSKMVTNNEELAMKFIQVLLQPKNYTNLPEMSQFYFSQKDVLELAERAERIMIEQPMVLRINAPVKVFGDIHGQYSDLMRFFELWGCPDDSIDGDIDHFDYLFLGDFVDRGNHSLETICLLMALKVKYSEQIHLIRGNHEDRHINSGFGFLEECSNRFLEGENNLVFDRINRFFDFLPLAAIIEEKIICLHGGIGSSLNYVEQIEALPRPLEVVHEVTREDEQLIVDILWSDPTDSDNELGIIPNCIRDPAGTGNIVKFGPDRVQQFLKNNNLSMIIRAHECVMDGFERFAGGSLITLFSATDYCGKHKNAGAVLIIRSNLEIIPKLIYPINMSANNWIEDEEALKKRPPTPPRWKNTMPRRISYNQLNYFQLLINNGRI